MRSRIIVVNDFYADPDAVRDMAMTFDYRSAGHYNYPGWQSCKSISIPDIRAVFEHLICSRIEFAPDKFTWGGFRVVTSDTGEITKVHADHVVHWAGLVFLTPNCDSTKGTGFFRHNETGLSGPPNDTEAQELGYASADDFELNVARRDMAKPGAWTMVDRIAPSYNRLLLFRGDALYHAGLGGAGHSLSTGRLTHVFFFKESAV